jgi:hypothetical protein
MHIFPGLFYGVKDIEVFWQDDLLLRFNGIMVRYSHKIMFQMGAHVHFGEIRAPRLNDLKEDDMKSVLIVCPSISPIYRNDPGYTVLDIKPTNKEEGYEIIGMDWRYYDFSERNKLDKFITLNPQKFFEIDINNYKSIRDLDERFINNPKYFAAYLRSRTGISSFGDYQANLYLSENGSEVSDESKNRFMSGTVCGRQYLTLESYNNCMREHVVL